MHVPLAAFNQTQLENGYDNMANPYDLGSSVKNLGQVFGAPGVDWAFPIRPLYPLSDGIAFRRGDFDLVEDAPAEDVGAAVTGERLWRIRYHVSAKPSDTGYDGPETVCTGCLR